PEDKHLSTIPIGRPISNIQLYVLNEHLSLLPKGVVGELHIGGVGVARGYWNKSELSREKFIRDPFSRQPNARLYKTGDLCRWREDGNLEYIGRNDHQIKIRGFRIELGEIEACLERHETVRAAVVIASGSEMDKRLVAYVVSDHSDSLA